MNYEEEREDYLRYLTIEKGRRPATVEAYRRDLRRFSEWCAERSFRLRALGSQQISEYLATLRREGMAPSSVSRHLSAVKGWCEYLAAEGALDANPAAQLPPAKRPKTLPKPLPEHDVVRLIDSVAGDSAIDRRDRALLELLYGTGARVSEAVGIELQHLDFDEELISVTGKGHKQRLVPMGRSLRDALRAYLAPEGRSALVGEGAKAFLFLNHHGAPLSRQGVDLIVRRRALAVGIPHRAISAHVFRHSCATHMLDHGADIRVVQELLGHASIATTQVYTAVSMSSLQAAYADAHPRAHG